ncbi:MAG: hypothetical protein LAT55_13595 [Opitutales bacterium]|nr:hypothetical protein [Opitutales bacterium]
MIKKDSLHLRKLGEPVNPDGVNFTTLFVNENGELVSKGYNQAERTLVYTEDQQTIDRKEIVTDRASFEAAVSRLNELGGGVIVLDGVIEIGEDSNLDVNLKNITVKADRTNASRIDLNGEQKKFIIRGGGTFEGVRFRNTNNTTHKNLFTYVFEEENEMLLTFKYCTFQNPQEITDATNEGHIEISVDSNYSLEKDGYVIFFDACDMFGPNNNGLTVYQNSGQFSFSIISATNFTRANKRVWRWRAAASSTNGTPQIRTDSIVIDESPTDNIFTGIYRNILGNKPIKLLNDNITIASAEDFEYNYVSTSSSNITVTIVGNPEISGLANGTKLEISKVGPGDISIVGDNIVVNGGTTFILTELFKKIEILKVTETDIVVLT